MRLHVSFEVEGRDVEELIGRTLDRLEQLAPGVHWRAELDITEGTKTMAEVLSWKAEVNAYRETTGAAPPKR